NLFIDNVALNFPQSGHPERPAEDCNDDNRSCYLNGPRELKVPDLAIRAQNEFSFAVYKSKQSADCRERILQYYLGLPIWPPIQPQLHSVSLLTNGMIPKLSSIAAGHASLATPQYFPTM
ncbi:MAG: hypothetical protein VXZ99_12965, partial [Pseudomonadota bacterium]|nr:hypothetical protein [Pseudomonadota bacterium]